MNLDRFAYGQRDAQAAKAVCYCDECGGEIYEGDLIHISPVTEDKRFCSSDCLLDNIGAKYTSVIIEH